MAAGKNKKAQRRFVERYRAAVFAGALAVLWLSGTVLCRAASAPDTLRNLMAAYDQGSDDYKRYGLYARKAMEEGYGAVASFYNALARSETIQLERYRSLILQLGGFPSAKVQILMAVRHTRENLLDATQNEAYQRREIYADYLARAKDEHADAAVRLFTDTLALQAKHIELCQKALRHLNEWKGLKKDFYLCPVCGLVVESVDYLPKCPVCGADIRPFQKVG